MTARVPIADKKRPRRELGEILTFVLHCPVCLGGGSLGIPPQSKVIAYRNKTVRMECCKCGVRYSVNWFETLIRLYQQGAPGWGDLAGRIGEDQAWKGIEAGLRAMGKWEQFLTATDGAVVTGEGS